MFNGSLAMSVNFQKFGFLSCIQATILPFEAAQDQEAIKVWCAIVCLTMFIGLKLLSP